MVPPLSSVGVPEAVTLIPATSATLIVTVLEVVLIGTAGLLGSS